MKRTITRTQFLAQSAAAAGTLLASPRLSFGSPTESAKEKLRVAIIGAGGMGAMAVGASGKEKIVAFCDVDATRAASAYQKHSTAPTY